MFSVVKNTMICQTVKIHESYVNGSIAVITLNYLPVGAFTYDIISYNLQLFILNYLRNRIVNLALLKISWLLLESNVTLNMQH